MVSPIGDCREVRKNTPSYLPQIKSDLGEKISGWGEGKHDETVDY
jgi:hypothetical protein